MQKKLDVVVIGELNIDLVLWRVPMPENEKEQLAEDMRFAMGSSSAITAHNLSAIGANVGFIGKAGNDTFGKYMIDALAAGGVDTSQIIVDDSLKTGATIVLANPPKEGFNLILWVFPIAAVVLGGVFFSRYVGSLRASAAGDESEFEENVAETRPVAQDDYQARLEDELRNR